MKYFVFTFYLAITSLLQADIKSFIKYELPPGVEHRKNLVYGKGGSQDLLLDLFLPAKDQARHPAVVFIHGGGWVGGNRGAFYPQCAALAGQGYVCASIDYRLIQEAPYPASIEDAKCAIRWMRAHAGDFGVDPDKIAAAGGSAGGHSVGMLGTTADRPEFEGHGGCQGVSSRVAAVVAFNGVFDMAGEYRHVYNPLRGFLRDLRLWSSGQKPSTRDVLLMMMGGKLEEVPEAYEAASPLHYVDKSSAPFLFLHGTKDRMVPFSQSEEMMARLQAEGVEAELYPAPGRDHAYFNLHPWYDLTLTRMEEFLKRHLY